MRKQNRITWGGLIRTMMRKRMDEPSIESSHVKYITKEGYTKYLRIKYDTKGFPYFVEV